MTDNELSALVERWERFAQQMEDECSDKPCGHSHGYRQAAYDVRHALASRKVPTDPTLIEAARAVLAAWDADDVQEKNDLSDELWLALGKLRDAVHYYKEER